MSFSALTSRTLSRRGTVLIIVLGILTILSVMGTAFARFMRTELQASKYYTLKKNVEQLAEDGITFASSKLAVVARQAHWSGLRGEQWPFETNTGIGRHNYTPPAGPGLPPTGYLYSRLESPNTRVSFPDLVADPGGRISWRREGSRSTMEPNGDVVKLKVLECQSQINVRSLALLGRWTFLRTLETLGEQLAAKTNSMNNNPLTPQVTGALWWVINGGDVSNIGGNPPPPENAMPFMPKVNFVNKEHFIESLRQIHEQIPALAGRNLWRYVEDAVTTTSWPFNGFPPARANQAYEDRDGAYGVPLNPIDGDSTYYTNRRDGLQGNAQFPGQKEQYFMTAAPMAPININTAPFEVIVSWLSRLEGERPYYDVRRFAWIVDSETNQVRLNEAGGGIDQTANRGNPAPGFANNSVLKFIRIGPFFRSTNPLTITNNTVERIAQLIIYERERRPFTSFQDFDMRLISRLDTQANGGFDVGQGAPCNGIDALPDPLHPLTTASLGVISLATGAGVPYPQCFSPNWETFYRAACRDLLRAALDPNPKVMKYNPDEAYFRNIDTQDIIYRVGPVCFHSYGVYEITSLAQINGPVFDAALGDYVSRPVAEAQVRAVVKLMDVLRHHTQTDFMTGIGQNIAQPPSSANQSLVSLTFGNQPLGSQNASAGTQTFPNCVNEGRNYGLFNVDPSFPRGGIAQPCPEWGYVQIRPQDRTPFQRYIHNPNGAYGIIGLMGYMGYNGWPQPFRFLQNGTRMCTHFIADLPPGGWQPSPMGEGFMRDQFWGANNTQAVTSRLAVAGVPLPNTTANNNGNVRQYTDFVPDGIYLRGHGRLNNDPNTPLEPNDAVTRYFRVAAGNNTNTANPATAYAGPINGVTAQSTSNGWFNQQNALQGNTNMPFYRGTVEFWIKFNVDFWDMTNANRAPNNQATPLSAHDSDSFFCGLIGCTEFQRRDNNNAEGMQMFIFKDVGQRLRITRLYFGQAFQRRGATADNLGNLTQMLDHADWKERDPNNGNFVQPNDLGVLYSRVDTIVLLNTLPHPILPHHWYHFAIGWDAGDPSPDNQVRVYINGRRCIIASELLAMSQGKANEGLNDGTVLDAAQNPPIIAKSAVLLNELDPTDRVTIGCIDRYMLAPNWCRGPGRLAIFATDVFPRLFQFAENPANPNLPFRLVAAANATIDTVRTTSDLINFNPIPNSQDRLDMYLFNRYETDVPNQFGVPSPAGFNPAAPGASGNTNNPMFYMGQNDPVPGPNSMSGIFYENGWQNPYAVPVQVAWISWDDYRPKNDPTRPMGAGNVGTGPAYLDYVPPQNNLQPWNSDYVQIVSSVVPAAQRGPDAWRRIRTGVNILINSEQYRPTAAAPQAVRDQFTGLPAIPMRRDSRDYKLPNTPNLTFYGGMSWEGGLTLEPNGLVLYRAYFRRGEQLIANGTMPCTTAVLDSVQVGLVVQPTYLEYTPIFKR